MKLSKTLTALAIALQAASHAMSTTPYNVCTYEMCGLPLIGPPTIRLKSNTTLISPGAVVKHDEDGNISEITPGQDESEFCEKDKIVFKGRINEINPYHDYNPGQYIIKCFAGHAIVRDPLSGIICKCKTKSLVAGSTINPLLRPDDGYMSLLIPNKARKGYKISHVMVKNKSIVSRPTSKPDLNHKKVIYGAKEALKIIKAADLFSIPVTADFLRTVEATRLKYLEVRRSSNIIPTQLGGHITYVDKGLWLRDTQYPYVGPGNKRIFNFGGFLIATYHCRAFNYHISPNICYAYTGTGPHDWTLYLGRGEAILTFHETDISINVTDAHEYKITIQITDDWLSKSLKSSEEIKNLVEDLKQNILPYGMRLTTTTSNHL
jgi:hypothetical protein